MHNQEESIEALGSIGLPEDGKLGQTSSEEGVETHIVVGGAPKLDASYPQR